MKTIRNLAALFAIPAVFAAGWTLIKTLLSFASVKNQDYIPFWIGILCYIVFQVLFYKPLLTYVFGHELTHAIAGILSGARIKKFKVGKRSGSVVLDKDNIWITLSPYFVPLYSFIVIFLYFMLGWQIDIRPLYSYFLFFLGFSIAFHIALTIYVLGIGQPDLKVYGVFFSMTTILIINIIVFSLLLILSFPHEISPSALFQAHFQNIKTMYTMIF
ncbi:MAG: hypothetical protein LBV16_03775 [Elusimicrobiota bacterium]|jgi:hypothetical protein|nr:hypothetical protein [Elusimicrobiota bacterium]